MTYFAKYDLATGAFRGGGSCALIDLPFQPGPGQGVVASDADVIVATEVDGVTQLSFSLDPVRAYLSNKLDDEAEQARLKYITAGAGQALTYQYKAAEAHAYTADNTALTPFLSAESALTGETVAAIAAEVIAAATAWVTIGAQIEAVRTHAKDGVASATNLLEMVTAAAVDWSAPTA